MFNCSLIIAGCVLCFSAVAQEMATVVDKPLVDGKNKHYVSNREPLARNPLIKLPVSAVKPSGWLKVILQRQRDGLNGHLNEISAWLQKEDNAWLSSDGSGKWGWEEVPYWLKGYGNLGYILEDDRVIAEAKVWIGATLASQHEDGNFGPVSRFADDNSFDFWANMIMLFCLQSYYEYSSDERVIDLMTKYFKHQLTVPDEAFLTHFWQNMRGGDNLYSVFWLYNRTGEPWLLELAEKIHRNTANWRQGDDLPTWHNVNIAQGFREPATYAMLSHDAADTQASYNNFKLVRDLYGQVPGGMFGSDENCRPGYDDPRQAVETCGAVEQMLSNEMLLRITGDPFWGDHTEDVAFNTYTAMLTPDMRALRYLTSPNMVMSDKENHSPGVQNSGPFLLMNPFSSRCCQHNHSHGWPYYCENLWMATQDNGLCAAIYSPSVVKATVGEGVEVTIAEETGYPFEEQVAFRLTLSQPAAFPLYFRIPAWCDGPIVTVNGATVTVPSAAKGYLCLARQWKSGDMIILELPMSVKVHTWEKNHNSVSVNYGPLTYSLLIKEDYVKVPSDDTAIRDSKWQAGVDTEKWPSWEILPKTPWNYGLILDPDTPAASFTVTRRDWPEDDFPFTDDTAPIQLHAKGKRIEAWTLDRYGLCAPLQDSPVVSDAPEEDITLVPMGAARLRISAFPVISQGSDGNKWQPEPTPPYNITASHCFSSDTLDALWDDLEPTNSNDHSIPRMTFWDHKGFREWIEYKFDEPKTISSCKVYWFDDNGKGQCRIPERWRIVYETDGRWRSVDAPESDYGIEKDAYNTVSFTPIKTTCIRLELKLQPDYSGGVLAWTFEE